MEHEGSLASPLGTWVSLSNDGIIIKDLLLPLAKLAGWAGDLASLAK